MKRHEHTMLRAASALALLMSACAAASARADQPAAVFRIALVSDTHTTRGTNEDQPLYRGRLDRVIAEVNAAKVDLVLIAGDVTQGAKPEEMSDFLAQIKEFTAPVRYVLGNHDAGGKRIEGKPGGITAERLARVEAGLGPAFWKYEAPGVRVLGVTASLFGSGLPREQDQWAFLERELAPTAPGSQQPATLLLLHYPLFLQTPDEPGGDYWNIEPEPRARLLALLKRGGVRAVLSGHLHYGAEASWSGIFFVTTPPVSFGLPRDRQPEGWTIVTLSADGSMSARTHFLPREGSSPATEKGAGQGTGSPR